jgi:hypothetical protein
VFVLDKHGHPLDPCHSARARRLPASGCAVLARHTPFVIRLKDRTSADGCEVREYLLEKWGRTCAYCGAQNVPLNLDHLHPRSRGGSDRISNLALACVACNQAKNATPATWSARTYRTGKKAGIHTGRVAVRSTGSFTITTPHGTVQSIGHRHTRLLQRADGYGYTPIQKLGTVLCLLPAPKDRVSTLEVIDEMARSLWVKASAWTKDRQV